MDIIRLTNRDIDENDKIADEIKADIKETFGDMLEFLGKENFLRWVRKQDISKVARQTIYKVCTEEEDLYLKEHKTVRGYHQRPYIGNGNQRTIVFKRDVGEGKDVRSHETWHAFADGLGGYSRFFGEGITEYLSKMLYDEKRYAYKDNVDVVDLMVSMYGVKVIREYLTKRGSTFFKEIASDINKSSLASKDGIDIASTIKKMDEDFNIFHDSVHEKNTTYTLQDGKEALKAAKDSFIDIYFAYERTKIEDLEYYADGKIDFEKYNKQLNTVAKKAANLGIDPEKLVAKYKALTLDLIESSHLLEGLSGDEREKARIEIRDKVYEQFNKYTKGEKDFKINQEEEPFKTVNKDAELKLTEKRMKLERFTNKEGKFDYKKYFDELSKLKNKTNMSDYLFNAIIAKTNLEMSEKPKEFTNFATRILKAYSEVTRLEEEREKDLSRVKMQKAKIRALEGQAFIEKKDDEYQILVVGEDGKINTIPLDKDRSTDIKGVYVKKITAFNVEGKPYPPNVVDDVKNKKTVFEVENIFRGNYKTYISINKDPDKDEIEINNENLPKEEQESWIAGFNNVKDTIMEDVVFEEIKKKIENGEYTVFPKSIEGLKYSTERINFDSRHVKFADFIDDYLAATTILPVDQNRGRLKELAAMMIDRGYSMNTIPYRADNDLGENPDPTVPTHRQRYNTALKEYAEDKKEMVNAIDRIVYMKKRVDKSPKDERVISDKMATLDEYEKDINTRIASLKPKRSKALLYFDESLSRDAIRDIIEESKEKTATSDFEGIVATIEENEKGKEEKIVEEEQK